MKLLLKGLCVAMFAMLLQSAAHAFPPAPEVLIYGLVKDQYGNPLASTSDLVILQTPGGAQVVTTIQPNIAIGVNYALRVPMDSGILPMLYTANALTNGEPYTLYVYANGATNLPLEMARSSFRIGQPAVSIEQNLTLGSDANNDGIPDSWETAFIQSLGLNLALTNLSANGVYTHDGRTLYQEYLLGNYPYNSNSFAVTILSQHAGSALLSFTATSSRTYSVSGSPDLKSWTPLAFTIPALGSPSMGSYFSTTIQPLQIQTIQPTNAPTVQFFRLMLQ